MTEQVRGSELGVSSVVGGVPAAGIHWAGEFHLLRTLGEKDAFVTQLARLGYKLNDFRVTVRRITGDGRKQIRYNVFVDELRDGRPYRGKAYLGGYGERWIDQFEVRASGDFPQAYTAP